MSNEEGAKRKEAKRKEAKRKEAKNNKEGRKEREK